MSGKHDASAPRGRTTDGLPATSRTCACQQRQAYTPAYLVCIRIALKSDAQWSISLIFIDGNPENNKRLARTAAGPIELLHIAGRLQSCRHGQYGWMEKVVVEWSTHSMGWPVIMDRAEMVRLQIVNLHTKCFARDRMVKLDPARRHCRAAWAELSCGYAGRAEARSGSGPATATAPDAAGELEPRGNTLSK